MYERAEARAAQALSHEREMTRESMNDLRGNHNKLFVNITLCI